MKRIKFYLHNVQDLFIFLDKYDGKSFDKIDEATWQSYSSSIYPNKSLKKTMELAATILVSDPDVILLTEVGGPESLENFNRHFLDNKFNEFIIEGNSDRGIDLGYLVKKDLPFEAQIQSYKEREIHFNYQNDKTNKSLKFSRDVLELRLLDENKKVWFISLLVHLKSKLDKEGKDIEGRARREAELKSLVEIYQELKIQYPKIPIILAGDFNGIAGRFDTEPEFESIYQTTELEDITELVNLPQAQRFSYLYFDKSHKIFFQQLDYFFLEKKFIPMIDDKNSHFLSFQRLDGPVYDLPQNIDEKLDAPSDHYPLQIWLDLDYHPFS